MCNIEARLKSTILNIYIRNMIELTTESINYGENRWKFLT